MARALVGYVASSAHVAQDVELCRLRARVRELEAEISELRAEAAAHRVLDGDRLQHAGVLTV